MPRKAKAKAKNPVGRPPSIVADQQTLDKIKILASAQHTQPEAAALLGISIRCFEEFLRANKNAREVWDEGRESGKASLRRMQFKNAQAGNVTMQIWLGKQYLGQKDKQEVENTGAIPVLVYQADKDV
jgi:hypothetical protein